MFNLNEVCLIAYENAVNREAKDGKVSTDTIQVPKDFLFPDKELVNVTVKDSCLNTVLTDELKK